MMEKDSAPEQAGDEVLAAPLPSLNVKTPEFPLNKW